MLEKYNFTGSQVILLPKMSKKYAKKVSVQITAKYMYQWFSRWKNQCVKYMIWVEEVWDIG